MPTTDDHRLAKQDQLYALLAGYAAKGKDIPSQLTLAIQIGWSARSVARCLRDLRDAGRIDEHLRPIGEDAETELEPEEEEEPEVQGSAPLMLAQSCTSCRHRLPRGPRYCARNTNPRAGRFGDRTCARWEGVTR